MSADDKAAAAWDDYVSKQQEEKIEELERELNAANESFRKLNIHTLNLVDRIKRLEKAGDAMASWAKASPDCHYLFHSDERSLRVNNWIKAREAKP